MNRHIHKGDDSRGGELAEALLAWYDSGARDLPWRYRRGETPDPYRVWLSEVMLQQTTVATVLPRFERFIERWPTLPDLAKADLDEVLSEWAGLGYYARARNLHQCARLLVDAHGGKFPDSVEALKELPGIGDYTAAAIGAILYESDAPVVDGNVERVIARLFAIETPLPQARPEVRRHAAALVPGERRGDFAQAMMDLGASICRPKNPACDSCPVQGYCRAFARGMQQDLPRRAARAEKPTRYGVAFLCRTGEGKLLLRRRADEGLLGGMMEPPSTPWRAAPWTAEEALAHAPLKADWREAAQPVRHTFTHFHLQLRVMTARVPPFNPEEGALYAPGELDSLALPTVMKKVLTISGF